MAYNLPNGTIQTSGDSILVDNIYGSGTFSNSQGYVYSESFGDQASFIGSGCVSIGFDASSSGGNPQDQVIIGKRARGTSRFTVAVGADSVSSQESVAIGRGATALSVAGVAIGHRAEAGQRSIVIGEDAGLRISDNDLQKSIYIGDSAGQFPTVPTFPVSLQQIGIGIDVPGMPGFNTVAIGSFAGGAYNTNCIFIGEYAGAQSSGDRNIEFLVNGSNNSPITAGMSDKLNIGGLIGGDRASGLVGINTSINPEAALHVDTPSATTTTTIFRSAVAQSTNISEWQDSAGTVVGSVSTTGRLDMRDVYGSGTFSNPQGYVYSESFGDQASFIGSGCVSIGFDANSSGSNPQDQVVIGKRARGGSRFTVAVGAESDASQEAVAVGRRAVGETACVAIGHRAESRGQRTIAIGEDAGQNLEGSIVFNSIFIGTEAGRNSNDDGFNFSQICIGDTAGAGMRGGYSVAIGILAGGDDNTNCVFIGPYAGNNSSGDRNIELLNTGSNNSPITAGMNDKINLGGIIGGDTSSGLLGINTSINPEAALHVDTPSATTTTTIFRSAAAQSTNISEWQDSAGTVVGSVSTTGRLDMRDVYASGFIQNPVGGVGSLALGQTTSVATHSTAIGFNADASIGTFATSIGPNSKTRGGSSVALGIAASASGGAVAIGFAYANAQNAIAIGSVARAEGTQSISIGNYAGLSNTSGNNIAIGSYAGSNYSVKQCLAIGVSAGTSLRGAYNVSIGKSANANAGTASDQVVNCVSIGKNAGIQIGGNYSGRRGAKDCVAIGANSLKAAPGTGNLEIRLSDNVVTASPCSGLSNRINIEGLIRGDWSAGTVGINTTMSPEATMHAESANSTDVTILGRAAASQSVDILRTEDSVGNPMFTVTAESGVTRHYISDDGGTNYERLSIGWDSPNGGTGLRNVWIGTEAGGTGTAALGILINSQKGNYATSPFIDEDSNYSAMMAVGLYTNIKNSDRCAMLAGNDGRIKNSTSSLIAGGQNLIIQDSATSFIGGGYANRVEDASNSAVIGGQSNNITTSNLSSITSSSYGAINSSLSAESNNLLSSSYRSTIRDSLRHTSFSTYRSNTSGVVGGVTIGGDRASNHLDHQFSINGGHFNLGAGYYGGACEIQRSIIHLANQTTTNSGDISLFINNSTSTGDIIYVLPSSTLQFDVRVSAYNATDDIGAAYRFEGAIRRNGSNSTATLGTITSGSWVEGAMTSADVYVAADDANDALQVYVSGISGKTINWSASVDYQQTRGGGEAGAARSDIGGVPVG